MRQYFRFQFSEHNSDITYTLISFSFSGTGLEKLKLVLFSDQLMELTDSQHEHPSVSRHMSVHLIPNNELLFTGPIINASASTPDILHAV